MFIYHLLINTFIGLLIDKDFFVCFLLLSLLLGLSELKIQEIPLLCNLTAHERRMMVVSRLPNIKVPSLFDNFDARRVISSFQIGIVVCIGTIIFKKK